MSVVKLQAVSLLAALVWVVGCGTIPPRAAGLTPYRPDVEALDIRATAAGSSAQPMTAPTPLSAVEEPAVRTLLPGDRLEVTLRMYPKTESFQCVIDESGTIYLDVVGRVAVGGKTATEAE